VLLLLFLLLLFGSLSSSFVVIKIIVIFYLLFNSRVPADCRIIDAVELSMNESSITGEPHAMKTGSALSIYSTGVKDPPPTEQKNIAFMGTLVCSGRGRAVVVSIGSHTEIGKVSHDLKKVESKKSPLQIKIDELGKMLAYGSTMMIAAMGILGWFLGRPFLETVTVAVSLAVAAIPEGLPICVTVTLALGVLKMARSNAIVKKLTSVETLGCATIVASDKTGTLTQNEMTARSIYTLAFPSSSFSLSGVGYDPKNGNLVHSNLTNKGLTDGKRKVDQNSNEFDSIQTLFAVSSLCNNATLSVNDNGGKIALSGQPTELALLVGAAKSSCPDPRPQYHRLQEIPFSSERKRMEVRARPVNGIHVSAAFVSAAKSNDASSDGAIYFVKGMPESILGDCSSYVSADGSIVQLREQEKTKVLSQSRKMASSGLRVLAMAFGADVDNLSFAGIVGMEDPPRKGVFESVQQLQQGGISVVMVTGDSKETAVAIARKCGIIQPPPYALSFEDDTLNQGRHFTSLESISDLEIGSGVALSGAELDAIEPSRLADSIIGIKVFYRVTPRHKLKLVEAYQSQGEIVAMTGDGVNDGPALKVSSIIYIPSKNH